MCADTLKDQVALRGTFTETEAWHFMEQMASAFAYMHSHNIVHRNIKLVNILCSRGVLKVVDFGLALFFTPGENIIAFGGTPGYMAPEVSEFEYKGPPADVWALGIVFTKLFLGLQFNGQDIIKVSPDTYDFIVVYSPPPSASEALVSLLTGMLLTDPSERFTMQEIVNHTWFKENHPMEV
uniref:non-specific serine/threonine protein kinase n=1 Tax=Eptatretus burgeri TaxID=7764 RepID=A0A8C4QJB9_EPTBU